MRAVDTNVLAHYLLNDDPLQSPVATQVLAQPTYVSDTVLVETAWLLASRYRLGRETLVAVFTELLRLPTVSVSNPTLIAWAIERFGDGADFADMMHVVSSRSADAFLSFETKLAKLAGANTPVPIETL